VTNLARYHTTLVFALLLVATGGVARAEITWQSQLKTAHAQAQAEGKLLLLHFYDDNCVWCDRLEKGAFQDPSVAQAIQQNFVAVKIHAGTNPAIASTFKVSRFPTDVIVTTQAQVLSHTVSPQEPARYIAMLEQQAATLASNKSSIAAATPPATNVSEVAVPPASVPAKTAAFTMPPAAGQTAAIAASVRKSVPQAESVSSSPTPEMAMDGFCPVSLVEMDRWVEGDPQLGAIHLGRLYLFSDQLAKDKFLANPESYTPMLNGIDVVRFFEERKIVQGNREWGLKDPDHNRMYFFADEAALNHFYNYHTRYTEAAMTVMAKAIQDSNPK